MRACRCSIRAAIAVAVSTVLAPLAFAAAPCEDLKDPCAAKACRIDADLARAKDKGNASDVARLERARSETSRCSAEGLKEKRKMAVEQAQRRVDKRTADLQRAEASGNPASIKKAQRNLESARKT